MVRKIQTPRATLRKRDFETDFMIKIKQLNLQLTKKQLNHLKDKDEF